MHGERGADHVLGDDRELLFDGPRTWQRLPRQPGLLQRAHDSEAGGTLTLATASQKEGSISFLDCGPEYSMAICEGGHVYTWGHGENGKLGHQDNNDKKLPTKVCVPALDE